MDPVVKLLIEKYGMKPDLATRTAANLKRPGAALDAYPEVSTLMAPPSPVVPQPRVVPKGSYDYEALKANYPAEFAPEIDKVARAYPNPERVRLPEGGIARVVQERFERRRPVPSPQVGDDGLTDADKQFNLRQQRAHYYKTLMRRAAVGEKLAPAEQAYLTQIRSLTSVSQVKAP